jgi:RecJ-like exonuclease
MPAAHFTARSHKLQPFFMRKQRECSLAPVPWGFFEENNMCETCTTTPCYEGCPFYEGNAKGDVCECCGARIGHGEDHYVRGGNCLCTRCAEQLSTGDLLDLGSLREIGDLLALIGYERVS